MRAAAATSLLFLLAFSWLDEDDSARRAFEEGRFDVAHDAFARAEEAAGDEADATLLFNRAQAALAAGRLRDAEASAERAAARAGPSGRPRRDFLAGGAAYTRCVVAEAQSSGPEAEPFAYDLAIGYASASARHFTAAASSTLDWPAARRNVERALVKLASLRAQRAEAEKRSAERKKDPGTSDRTPEQEEERAPDSVAQEFDQDGELVSRLLERLAAKDEERRALRDEVRRVRSADVEKDW